MILFMVIFWIGTILLAYMPFFGYKQMIQTELDMAPFIQSIEDIQDKKILKYKQDLEKKYNNRDSKFRKIIV